MDVTELRIGNIVLNEKDEPIRITYLSGQFAQEVLKASIRIYGQNINHTEHLSGLRIDNAWLKKLGFEGRASDLWIIDGIKLYRYGDTYKVMDIPGPDLHYVHQLQNLLYTLRGFDVHVFI